MSVIQQIMVLELIVAGLIPIILLIGLLLAKSEDQPDDLREARVPALGDRLNPLRRRP